MDEFPTTGRLAGIDYGSVRIGVALCDPDRIIASPHDNYTRRSIESDANYFRKLTAEYRIVGFVVGLPIHNSGYESQKSTEVRKFAVWLHDVTGLPVRFCDERYSTNQAEVMLSAQKFTSGKKKQRLDKVAAQVILTAYLENVKHGADPNESIRRSLDDRNTTRS